MRATGSRAARLREEREHLEEEIRQLQAAVHIYTELARRLAASTGRMITGDFRPAA